MVYSYTEKSLCHFIYPQETIGAYWEQSYLINYVLEESEKVGLKINIQKTKIMASGPITSWQIDGETMKTVRNFIFGGAPKSLQMVTAAMKLKDACSLEESYDQPR